MTRALLLLFLCVSTSAIKIFLNGQTGKDIAGCGTRTKPCATLATAFARTSKDPNLDVVVLDTSETSSGSAKFRFSSITPLRVTIYGSNKLEPDEPALSGSMIVNFPGTLTFHGIVVELELNVNGTTGPTPAVTFHNSTLYNCQLDFEAAAPLTISDHSFVYAMEPDHESAIDLKYASLRVSQTYHECLEFSPIDSCLMVHYKLFGVVATFDKVSVDSGSFIEAERSIINIMDSSIKNFDDALELDECNVTLRSSRFESKTDGMAFDYQINGPKTSAALFLSVSNCSFHNVAIVVSDVPDVLMITDNQYYNSEVKIGQEYSQEVIWDAAGSKFFDSTVVIPSVRRLYNANFTGSSVLIADHGRTELYYVHFHGVTTKFPLQFSNRVREVAMEGVDMNFATGYSAVSISANTSVYWWRNLKITVPEQRINFQKKPFLMVNEVAAEAQNTANCFGDLTCEECWSVNGLCGTMPDGRAMCSSMNSASAMSLFSTKICEVNTSPYIFYASTAYLAVVFVLAGLLFLGMVALCVFSCVKQYRNK